VIVSVAFETVPAEQYHAVRGLYMTSHRMVAARKSLTDFIEDARNPIGDSDALYFGRAAHVYTLEGIEAFHRSYVIGGPVNPRTGKTFGTDSKKFREWSATQPLPAISPEEFALIERMDRAVKGQRAAQQLLASGKAEVTGRTEIAGVPCQIRLDWLSSDDRIVDYKTCSDLSTISIDVEQYGYVTQQAFYRQCVAKLIGKLCPVYLIWCEKSGESPAVVWRLDDDRLDHEAKENERVIEEVKEVFFKLAKEKAKCLSEPSSMTSTPKSLPVSHHQLQPGQLAGSAT
jgi:hypothetical protein